MSISEILQSEMIKNIWCSNMQDHQYSFKPSRITTGRGISGVFNVPEVHRGIIDLPTTNLNDKYIVYQLGNIFNDYVDLPVMRNIWLNARGIIGFNNIMIDIYSSKGFCYPRFLVWCYMTQSNNVLLAVKREDAVDVFPVDDLYIRLYSNAYFKSSRYDSTVNGMECAGDIVTTTSSAAVLQQKYATLLEKEGEVLCWVNGVLRKEINQTQLVTGDCVDMVWDSSIYKVRDFDVSDLQTFHSELDGVDKYLIHDRTEDEDDFIQYYDDNDIYIIGKDNSTVKGSYLYRHNASAVRMLTHRDYAIPTQSIEYIVGENDHIDNVTNATVRIYYRKSPYDRDLVNESRRISNLYELPSDDILPAMIGMSATITEWTASKLEMSKYVEAMRRPELGMTQVELQDLFGYHGIVSYTASAFHSFEESIQITVPYSLRESFTAYEYDADGLFINRHTGSNLSAYGRQNDAASYVELIARVGSNRVYDYYNMDEVSLQSANCLYRVYQSDLINGVPTGIWVDITDSDRVTLIGTTIAVSDLDTAREEILVREDTNHLSSLLSVAEDDEVIEFTVNTVYEIEGVLVEQASKLPYLNTVIIMNGHTLVRGIDYVMDWPRIVITTNSYRVEGINTILVRGNGLPTDEAMSVVDYGETGFTDFGYLSRNGIYNIRDGYNLKYVVGGRIYRQEDLAFGDVANAPVISNYADGLPYYVQDYVQSIRGLVNLDPFRSYLDSKAFTSKIENYMSTKLPEPDMTLVENILTETNPLLTNNAVNAIVTGDYSTKYYPDATNVLQASLTVDATGTALNSDQMWSLGLRGNGDVVVTSAGVSVTATLGDEYSRLNLGFVQDAADLHTLSIQYTSSDGTELEVRGIAQYPGTVSKPYNFDGKRVYFDRYELSSPFMTKAYNDMRNGVISAVQVEGTTTDSQVISYMKNWEYLIPYDPTKQGHDDAYVEFKCFPNMEGRPARQREIDFLNRISNLYFGGVYSPEDELTVVAGE